MRRALHVAGRAGFALGMTGVVVGLAASPALAATGSLTVTPTGTVDQNVVIKATGSYDNSTGTTSETLKLTVTRPDSSSSVLYTGSAPALRKGTTPTESVDTSVLNVNGNYVFTYSIGGAATDTKTVTMRVAPAKVTGFAASASGTVAHFSWSPNSEPDLAGYDLIDVTDSSPRDLTPGGVGTNVCDSSGCSVDIDFGSSAAGTSRKFVVDAVRYTSPSHSATITSADSDPATVNFPAPPPPSSGSSGSGGSTGSSGGTSGGSTGGSSGGSSGSTGSNSTGGSTSGGTTGRTGSGSSGHPLSANHPNAALKAYLPSFSAGSAPNLPSVVTEVKPLPEGTYKPTLAYPDQVVNEAVHHSRPAAAVGDEIVHVLNVAAVWKSLAGAALVLLIAAHLRAWLAGVESDT